MRCLCVSWIQWHFLVDVINGYPSEGQITTYDHKISPRKILAMCDIKWLALVSLSFLSVRCTSHVSVEDSLCQHRLYADKLILYRMW